MLAAITVISVMNISFHSMRIVSFICLFETILGLFVLILIFLTVSSLELKLKSIEAWFSERVPWFATHCLVGSFMEN